jgi:membrane carboxypeptidase/penicillin-binding protein
MEQAMTHPPVLVPRDSNRRMSGYHVVDHIRREARRVADIGLLSDDAYVIRSTLDARIQQSAEAALQDGLADYERAMGRARFDSAEMNLRDRVDALRRAPAGNLPPWQQALTSARLPLYDVHWPAAVLLDRADTKPRQGNLWVGLADGRIVALQGAAGRKLKAYDVIYVRLATTKKQRDHGRASDPSEGAGGGRGDRQRNRRDPGDDRGLFLSAEPAQPRHAVMAAAGLCVQAAHLSRGARQRAAAHHADQ